MRVRVAVLLVVALTTGCNRRQDLPMDTESFVSVMVELRRAAAEGGAYSARRDDILRQAGVTESDLREYVRQATSRPQELSAAFDSITARLMIANEVQ